jgi:phospholipase C
MDSRREFIKKAAMLSGAAGLLSVLPPSIQKALAIDPQPGSTYLDAEHVVILMQENRSFDHCFGSLRGVRGFNDPRAITLPNKNLVWLQTNEAGETYTPFRLNMKDSKATWMGSLPHSWSNQVDARNDGKYDKWLIAKQAGHRDYTKMPLTQGFYNREDIPFYYALADAFTVCDQNYCSSLTGTTPNRLFLWTGTVREKQDAESYANVRNENVDYDKPASWTTFPERLEDNNVSWRIYQNEISLPMGFKGEEESWLANFTDNPIEWFKQYHVRYSTGFQKYLKTQAEQLPKDIAELENKFKTLPTGNEAEKAQKALKEKMATYEIVKKEMAEWSPENFAKLTQREKNLHQQAFTTNSKDPHYHEITTLKYRDGETDREVKLPKGDILHQFREDVETGKLPTVSWLVAPENFSDHPTSPWYGAWYVSEVMDILTKDPEIWKKTIFILCYDENDGYFDHVPPYVVPNPYKEDTGKVSEGIDTKVEFVTLEQDMQKKERKESRESPIGLGFRVPLIIASPWNRGGSVCSEVFDHTSIIQFLEKFTSHKSGKKIEETNISTWRRTICGDLTSTFKPYDGKKILLPAFVEKDEFIEGIHKAKFKGLPNGYKSLTAEEISKINQNPAGSPYMPQQENGIRPACALPYQLYADGHLTADKKTFEIRFKSVNSFFGKETAGAPFMAYAPGSYQGEKVKVWNYAVKAGDTLSDSYNVENFENQNYHLRVYGPNGFFREYTGNSNDPLVAIQCEYQVDKNKKPTGNIELKLKNSESKNKLVVEIVDNSYNSTAQKKILGAAGSKDSEATLVINLEKSYNWYDFSIRLEGNKSFEKRFAGHVETGKESQSDPLMARLTI